MSNIDYQALREAAQNYQSTLAWYQEKPDSPNAEQDCDAALAVFKREILHREVDIIAGLLDELDEKQQYIKSRDQENEDIALTVGRLLIENGRLVADTLRHLADNEIDSDYFAICHTNENGTEIECELAITDYARQAAGTVDDLVNALEVAEKRIAELEAREISLPERSSMLHRTDFHEDYQTVMAYKVSEVIAAIRAAGIRIKGE